jgi:hypothetical protein
MYKEGCDTRSSIHKNCHHGAEAYKKVASGVYGL